MAFEIVSHSVDETISLGRRIGEQLKGGEIIGLVGTLGTGKTHLIKGIAAGLGSVDLRNVNSPTFVIINEYRGGRLDVFHIDAYRLESIAEFEMLGFDDYCYADSVVMIEWADKIERALAGLEIIRIELSHCGPNDRTIRITSLPVYIGL
ncbi:MAG: tRNA (adenosine(37)-N6)-threonylcarbamoyltransferase complex ATPase subunit type 1 TsaE [Planctomycetota bacterium]